MAVSRSDPLENVVERTLNEIDSDKISIGDVLDLFGDRSFGPVIALLGLIVVVPPIGAIPVLPAIVGCIIILFSAQILFGANHIWVPDFIKKQSIPKEKLQDADKRAKPWFQRIDRFISERLEFMTGRWSVNIAAVFVSLMGLLMIPLELVPFAVAAPGIAVVVFGLAFVARDGVLMLIGYGLAAAALGLAIFAVPWQSFFGG